MKDWNPTILQSYYCRKCNAERPGEWADKMIAMVHSDWRADKITDTQFAKVVDWVLCF